MITVVPELGDAVHDVLLDLYALSETYTDGWTLIGAQMVALHGWEGGRQAPRPSQDFDVLVNVRLLTHGTRDVSRFLIDRRYEPEISANGMAHLFRRGEAEIDVLAPDGLGRRADLRTVPPNRTTAVPGGSQALSRSELTALRSREVEGRIPRPNLLGAILIKLRAVDVDDVPEAQRADVAFLLSLVEDPDALREQLRSQEPAWLYRHAYFGDSAHEIWASIDGVDPEYCALIYRRLADL